MLPTHRDGALSPTGDPIQTAAALIAAREEARLLQRLPPESAPQSVAESYAVQDIIVNQAGGPGGWKIAPRPNGGEFLCSPIPAAFFVRGDVAIARADLVRPEAEVELAVRIGADLPGRSLPYSVDEVIAVVAEVIPIVEIISSRFVDRHAVDPLWTLADLQNCGAVVIGNGGAAWDAVDMSSIELSMRINGVEAGVATGGAASHHVAAALVWLANHAAARALGLKRGDIVITGARVGPIAVQRGARIEGTAHSLGTVSFTV